NLPTVKAISVADADNDGVLDLLAVESTGNIASISFNEKSGWKETALVQVPNPAAALAGEVRLQVADLDNNGALDLVLSSVAAPDTPSKTTPLIWLGDSAPKFPLLQSAPTDSATFVLSTLCVA